MMMRALVIKNRLGLIIFSVLLMIFTSVMAYAGDERFVFSDLTATDKKTGLMWTRDANIAKKGKGMTYGTDGSMIWKEAFKFIEKLNKQKYAGHNDWRLPKKEELRTIVDYAKKKQRYEIELSEVLKKFGFKNVNSTFYWSSTVYAGTDYTDAAWGAFVDVGVMGYYDKTFFYYVWPVRAGQ